MLKYHNRVITERERYFIMVVSIIEKVYSFLWGDWIKIPLPGGGSLGISLLIILLIPTGIYFTIRTKFLQIRLFPDMVRALVAKKEHKDSLSTFQTLIVSTATRVGMGNLVGVVAAVSAGGAGAVFWMWITALIGSATAFIEATLAQLHKEKIRCMAVTAVVRHIISIIFLKKSQERRKTCAGGSVICHIRSDLLVWNQPGNQ